MLILVFFNNYIPDFLGGGEGFNRTCFVVGIIVCIVYVALVMKNRADRAKKGYSVEAFWWYCGEDGPDLCSCSCFLCSDLLSTKVFRILFSGLQ